MKRQAYDIDTKINLRDSVGFNLLKVVFSFYLIIAIIVTAAHMIIEYFNVKERVQNDLALYQYTFEESLADALWDLDEQRVATVSQGILRLPSVVGLKVFDTDKNLISQLGELPPDEQLGSGTTLTDYFSFNFPIFYVRESENTKVGEAVLYSNSSVILDALSSNFILILINSIIKTAALWIIFLFTVKPSIIEPVLALTKAVRSLSKEDFDQNKLESFQVNMTRQKRDEIRILEEEFNLMAEKILASKSSLKELNHSLTSSKQKLEALLKGTHALTQASRKLSACSYAIGTIVEILEGVELDEVNVYIHDYIRENVSGFKIFSLDDLALRGRDFNFAEFDFRFIGSQTNTELKNLLNIEFENEQEIIEQEKRVFLPIKFDQSVLAIIELVSNRELSVSTQELRFISTLQRSLAISLKELEIRNGLEEAVERKTSELRKSTLILEERTRELARTSKYKSEFLANMSHEIRTPMNAIIGFSERGARIKTDQEAMSFFKKIHQSGEYLLVIINDILDISKIEAGKMVLEKVDFNLAEVVNAAVSLVSQEANRKGINIYVKLLGDVEHFLVGDPSRLQQILVNLLSNAIKFTEKGYVQLQITRLARTKENVNLSFKISDTGIGIEQDKLVTLFDSFTQADSSITRKFGGTGLGLSISKRLVELMKGDISVDSRVNVGTSFLFNACFGNRVEDEYRERVVSACERLEGEKRVLVALSDERESHIVRSLLLSLGLKPTALSVSELSQQKTNLDEFLIVFLDQEALTSSDDLKNLKGNNTRVVLLNSGIVSKELESIDEFSFIKRPLLASKVESILTTPVAKNSQSTDSKDNDAEWWLDGRFRDRNILVVEDNLMNQELIKGVLEECGLKITIANNGLECLELISKDNNGCPFELIFMDIQMPEMDGITATENIRKKYNLSELPIIAMTAHALEEDRQKSLNAGMNGHITKPIDLREVFENLDKHLTD